jgi:hypothetical protein
MNTGYKPARFIYLGSVLTFPQRLRRSSASMLNGYRWFLSRAEALRASDGTLLYWIGINLDSAENVADKRWA